MNDLEVRKEYLPSTLKELQKFVLVNKARLTAVKAVIKAIDKLGLAQEVQEQKLQEGQIIAEALLDAETKMGELLKGVANPTASRAGRRQLPEGITHKQSHDYQELANNQDLVEEVIQEAIDNKELPTKTAVTNKIQKKKRQERNESLKNTAQELPQDTFQVIYADPPWEYSNSGFAMSAENQYPTMPTDKIKELKPKTTDDAICFLWVTNPLLKEGLEVLEAWGFEYKTNFVWTKERHTAGFYVFGQHELLLIGIKGSMLPIGEKSKSIITGENKIHSKKPKVVYEIIETMYPGLKYLEMFARSKKEKWTSWGNEI